MDFIEENIYKDKFGIYGIKNKINNKVYVGQTGDRFVRRYWHHCWKLKDNSHDNVYLQNAWNKYGECNFDFFVIKIINDKNQEILDEMEKHYIKKYRKLGLSYNILDGGGGRNGVPMSKNAKQIIGEKNRVNMTGKKLSEETKSKMSLTHKSNYRNHKRHNRNNVLDENIAFKAKKLLMNGIPAKDVAKKLNVTYGSINGIISNNAWSVVYVDGWEDFLKNKETTYRLKKEDAEKIRELYNNGSSIKELCNIYQKTRHTISNIVHYRTFK